MKRARNNTAGFTFIELMIVVAIIGMLTAIALPAFFTYRRGVHRGVCITHLKQIQDAKTRWCFDERKSLTDTPVQADLVGSSNYLRDMLYCPAGGDDYFTTIGTVGERAACSLAAQEDHVLP